MALLLDSSDEEDEVSVCPAKTYWKAIRERYRHESFDLSSLASVRKAAAEINALPEPLHVSTPDLFQFGRLI